MREYCLQYPMLDDAVTSSSVDGEHCLPFPGEPAKDIAALIQN